MPRQNHPKGSSIQAAALDPERSSQYCWARGLGTLLIATIILQSLLPLGTAIQIGADEGFELAKARLCLSGYSLYTEAWNDQPPLHTFLVTQLLKHISVSVLWPRILTGAFALLLLASFFSLVRRVSFRLEADLFPPTHPSKLPPECSAFSNRLGLNCGLAAFLATSLLLLSPGFIELSASCMLELPSLACSVAALCLLAPGGPKADQSGIGPGANAWGGLRSQLGRSEFRLIFSAILFACALQMKLVPAYLLPLAAILIWLREQRTIAPFRRTAVLLFAYGATLVIAYVGIDLVIERGAYLRHFSQSFGSHFGKAVSFEHGSAQDHPFEWVILMRNWDTTIPAVIGIIVALRQIPSRFRSFFSKPSTKAGLDEASRGAFQSWIQALLPVLWLGLALVVFSIHKPWWSYYYIHIALPLCWCAGLGLVASLEFLRCHKAIVARVAFGLVITAALIWSIARVYLQVSTVRSLPKIYQILAIDRIKKLGHIKFLYAEEPIYSFHAGVPMPPQLAVLPLKRFWMGDMTSTRLASELAQARPEAILLSSNTAERSFDDLLASEYRLVYMDGLCRLYVLKPLWKAP
jgi:hypothetical protein